MIPTGNKKEKSEVSPTSPFFYLLPPPVSVLAVFILSIRSEDVMLFLVLLIHINTHSRMEINLWSWLGRFLFFLKELLLSDISYIELLTRKI